MYLFYCGYLVLAVYYVLRGRVSCLHPQHTPVSRAGFEQKQPAQYSINIC